jgi:multidrug efflux pump subunit AcrA (membrane-fusion protein)
MLRDGFSWVFRLGADNRVQQLKVEVGRRVGDRVEIRGGLDPAARVVASGVGFLADGDTVRLVAAPPAITPPLPPSQTPAAAPAAAGK